MHTTVVRFRDTELTVSFEYEAGEKEGRYSPPSPEGIEITDVRSHQDLSGLLEGDALEEIAKLVKLEKKESR